MFGAIRRVSLTRRGSSDSDLPTQGSIAQPVAKPPTMESIPQSMPSPSLDSSASARSSLQAPTQKLNSSSPASELPTTWTEWNYLYQNVRSIFFDFPFFPLTLPLRRASSTSTTHPLPPPTSAQASTPPERASSVLPSPQTKANVNEQSTRSVRCSSTKARLRSVGGRCRTQWTRVTCLLCRRRRTTRRAASISPRRTLLPPRLSQRRPPSWTVSRRVRTVRCTRLSRGLRRRRRRGLACRRRPSRSWTAINRFVFSVSSFPLVVADTVSFLSASWRTAPAPS